MGCSLRGRMGPVRVTIILAAALTALALGSCGDRESTEPQPSSNDPSELGPIHVHGLGVNPADGALFIATHTGMFRLASGDSDPVRVGGNFQDTMGFTVVGPDSFLGSGHPDPRGDLPPFLGLIESSDAGNSWQPRSLLGDADFHVLEAQGERVYGFGSDFTTREEQFLISRDGGQNWSEEEPPESLLSLAINPADPEELIASGPEALYRSVDGARSWRPVAGEPGLLSWPEPDQLLLVDGGGSVATSAAPGSPWQVTGEIGGEPAAFEAASSDVLHVALHDGTIQESLDGGESWNVRSAP